MEYSQSGSKEWSSLRTTKNYTEIKNLQVNALYTVRVSIFGALSVGALCMSLLLFARQSKSHTVNQLLKKYAVKILLFNVSPQQGPGICANNVYSLKPRIMALDLLLLPGGQAVL